MEAQSGNTCLKHVELNLETLAGCLGSRWRREGLVCSHEALHISSSSKLGQEMWLSLQFSPGRHGAAQPTQSSVQRKTKGAGHQICTQTVTRVQ